jgi:hypothetical protein
MASECQGTGAVLLRSITMGRPACHHIATCITAARWGEVADAVNFRRLTHPVRIVSTDARPCGTCRRSCDRFTGGTCDWRGEAAQQFIRGSCARLRGCLRFVRRGCARSLIHTRFAGRDCDRGTRVARALRRDFNRVMREFLREPNTASAAAIPAMCRLVATCLPRETLRSRSRRRLLSAKPRANPPKGGDAKPPI